MTFPDIGDHVVFVNPVTGQTIEGRIHQLSVDSPDVAPFFIAKTPQEDDPFVWGYVHTILSINGVST